MINTGKTFIARDIAEGKISKPKPSCSWRKYRIAPELEALGMGAFRLLPVQVAMGLVDSSPEPRGKATHFWVMRLRQLPCRNRLPRGFSKQPLFV